MQQTKKASVLYLANSLKASSVYKEKVQDFITREEEKLENLPESLQEAQKGQDISSSIDVLEEVLEEIENAENAFKEIENLLGVKVAIFPDRITASKLVEANDKRLDFHAILPKQIALDLKNRSILSGLSMNEILCEALKTFLFS